jgi:hypothetical protein
MSSNPSSGRIITDLTYQPSFLHSVAQVSEKARQVTIYQPHINQKLAEIHRHSDYSACGRKYKFFTPRVTAITALFHKRAVGSLQSMVKYIDASECGSI